MGKARECDRGCVAQIAPAAPEIVSLSLLIAQILPKFLIFVFSYSPRSVYIPFIITFNYMREWLKHKDTDYISNLERF